MSHISISHVTHANKSSHTYSHICRVYSAQGCRHIAYTYSHVFTRIHTYSHVFTRMQGQRARLQTYRVHVMIGLFCPVMTGLFCTVMIGLFCTVMIELFCTHTAGSTARKAADVSRTRVKGPAKQVLDQVNILKSQLATQFAMGWLRLVGSLKL